MKNPVIFYAVIGLGILALIAGVAMLTALHFHGKAYAVIGLGAVLLIAGVAGMFVGKPAAAK